MLYELKLIIINIIIIDCKTIYILDFAVLVKVIYEKYCITFSSLCYTVYKFYEILNIK